MKPKKKTLKRVMQIFSPKERRSLSFVMVASILSSLVDVAGVGAIAPFLSVAANPEVIKKNVVFNQIFTFFSFSKAQDFLIAMGIFVIGLVLLTNLFRLLARYLTVRFTSQARHAVSMKLMNGYLQQDYTFFLSRNSHEFVKNLNSEVQIMIQGTLMTFVEILGSSIQVLLYISLLVFVQPLITLIIAGSIGIIYGSIFLLLRRRVKKLGQNRYDFNRERARIASETFWSIKETKLMGLEQAFVSQYQIPSAKLAKNESDVEVVSDVPKFTLEAVIFSTILLIVLFIVIQTGGFQDAAVTVGLFLYASYRMMPSMQNLFKALSKFKYGTASSDKLCDEFDGLNLTAKNFEESKEKRVLKKEIRLENLHFQYPESARVIVNNLSLSLPVRKTIGFAGSTGSGKTTLIDLILGLLEPQSGQILIDGEELNKTNRSSWQSIIGYVPQNIFLTNSSLEKNIAFGIPENEIDKERVQIAASQAQIHDFIVTHLPQQYKTEVGERGVRLSGGQRQRIGIARALYRNPQVLVFDEATSALDHETESAVMEAVNRLNGSLTMLMIAHRLTTLRNCDHIYILEKGQILDSGKFDELAERHSAFQKGIK